MMLLVEILLRVFLLQVIVISGVMVSMKQT